MALNKAINVYFTGTAGSGKTALTNAFLEWVKLQGYDAIAVNLDPGAEFVPYPAELDIRDYISLTEIMGKYSLGPNGAQIVACDMIALKINEIKNELSDYDTDFILIDTPGQLELFTFRNSSRVIVEALDDNNSFITFLFDPALCKNASDFVSLLLLSLSVSFRFSIPLVNVLTKTDMISEQEKERIISYGSSFEHLYADLMLERGSMVKEASFELLKAIENISLTPSIIPLSANTRQGMEELYNAIAQFYFGGEDLEER